MVRVEQHDFWSSVARRLDRETSKRFILAGNAHFTIRYDESTGIDAGKRLTFKVRRSKPKPGDDRPPVHFVSFKVNLDPTDNKGYEYMGVIYEGRRYWHSPKSKIEASEASVIEFRAFLAGLLADCLPDYIQVYHEGSCGRCGRRLTVPESIQTGFGPECIEIMEGR